MNPFLKQLKTLEPSFISLFKLISELIENLKYFLSLNSSLHSCPSRCSVLKFFLLYLNLSQIINPETITIRK